MKITNVRVLNNYKVKLINAKLSGVNSSQGIVAEQGTRTPVIITEGPSQEFQEKFNLVLSYLVNRYEPGWSAATPQLGKAATMQLLGVSGSLNPLILGGSAEAAFNGNTSSDIGWFDIFTHPRDFAAAVRGAYKTYGRARKPSKAKHRFMSYSANGLGEYSSQIGKDGGNMFLGANKDMVWYPEPTSKSSFYLGLNENYSNSIERQILHSPYAVLRSPMFSNQNRQSLPWISDRYAPAEGLLFDQYLLMRETTTLRDLLNNYDVSRNASLGVLVNGVGDSHIDTLYRDSSYPDGVYSQVFGSRTGGYSADQVAIGSPWITYPNGLTWSGGFFDLSVVHGLCFDTRTLVLFDGSTFPSNPSTITDRLLAFDSGISYGYGERRLTGLNALSDQWGNSMEFTLYLGRLPYGLSHEQQIPWMLYKDPTLSGNKEYFKWRLDASVQHAKDKFISPIDGFAHIVQDSGADIERTYHRYNGDGYTAWSNDHPSGISYIENIPVEWARDQYRYTYGSSGPNPSRGVVYGVGGFDWNDWLYSSNDTSFKRNPSDTTPRNWCLDTDIAASLYMPQYDMLMGQRYNGISMANQMWGAGVCGSSTLGEILTLCTTTDQGDIDAYPFFYNTFIEYDGSALKWKGVPNTTYSDNGLVPWYNDRRFTLFYLYPTILALGGTVVDHFHDGIGYYSTESRWFDKNLGSLFTSDMETRSLGNVVSDIPFPERRTPTKPPQNFWNGIARTSEFELLYACMKAGIYDGLESLYFNELYDELKNGLINPPDSSRTSYSASLDFAIFAASYVPGDVDSDENPLYPSIVPLIKPSIVDGSTFTYRGNVDPGSTAGMPTLEFEYNYRVLSNQIPQQRRVFYPSYWQLDGPPGGRRNTYHFKQLSDGTTYTGSATGLTFLSTDYGGTWQYGDTNPLKFMTPWADQNRHIAKTSFGNFLVQAKNAGLVFSFVHDGINTASSMSPSSDAFSSRTQTQLIQYAVGNSGEVIPDARHIEAIVDDARFNGVTSAISNRTFAQEFKHQYDQILSANGMGACGASAEDILRFFITPSNRLDFRQTQFDSENLLALYAWDATNHVFCNGNLRSSIVEDTLRETTGFESCVVYSSDMYGMSAEEGKYAVDPYGHMIVKPYINGHGACVRSLGELANYIRTDYGYPPLPSSDANVKYGQKFGFHPVDDGGITFSSTAYHAMIADLKRVRGILRTRPQVVSDGFSAIINGGLTNGSSLAAFGTGSEAESYFLEHIYHHCLSGVNHFIVYNTNGNVSLVDTALRNWRTQSNNSVAIPCDSTGSTSGLVDRIDLHQAGINLVASGAYIGNADTRLWRLTAPSGVNSFVKSSTAQTSLPDTIAIPSGSRGVWLEAPASYGVPSYTSATLQHEISVSPTGSDSANGVDAPVQTIARAMQLVADYNGSLPVLVDIQPGTYEMFGSTIQLGISHAGSNTSTPLTIRAAQQDSVIITGAKTLDVSGITLINSSDPMYSRFKESVRSNIYKVDLSGFDVKDVGLFGNVQFTYPIYGLQDDIDVETYSGRRLGFKDLPTLPEVSFNGEPLTLARFPSIANNAFSTEFSFDSSAIVSRVIEPGSGFSVVTPGNTNGIFEYPSGVCYGIDYSGITRWANRVGPTADIYVHGHWRWDWNDEAYRVSSIDTDNRRISVQSRDSGYGLGGVTSCTVYHPANPSPRRWFALNVPEELDVAGEYYISRNRLPSGALAIDNNKTDVLYFIPPIGITSGTKLRVSSSKLSGGVVWKDGTENYNPLIGAPRFQDPTNAIDTLASIFKLYRTDNIVFDGLIFDTCSGTAIEMNQCSNIVVKNCKIRNMRKNGISILDGQNVLVDNCDIRHTGLKGIILTGGNRQTLEGCNNRVSNCTIKQFGRLSHSNGAAIQMSGVGNTIYRNLICDGNGKAIDYSGNNNVIEGNHFANVNLYSDDMGAVYKYADPSHVGNVIRGNFFNYIESRLPGGPRYQECGVTLVHNSCAIYLDYSGGGDEISGNVFYKCGSSMSDEINAIFIAGTNITIANNVFIDCPRPAGFVKFNTVNYNNLWTIGGIKQSTFNKDDEEWLTRTSSASLGTGDKRYGYTPYSYFETNYGEATISESTNAAYAGLYNKVNIQSSNWVQAYPYLSSIMQYNSGTDMITINFAQINNPANLVLVKNNVCIGTTTGTTTAFFEQVYATAPLYGGFTFAGGITFSALDAATLYFENFDDKNFKLTGYGLNKIRESIPQFVGVSFENIPLYSV